VTGLLKTKHDETKSTETFADVRFCVFDILQTHDEQEDSVEDVTTKPFEERQEILAEVVAQIPVCQVVKQTLCMGKQQLETMLNEVVKGGGEGVMLRAPKSTYEKKRSKTLLKVKRVLEMDVLVTGYTDGEGKHKGRVGALLVETRDHIQFKVGAGLTDKDRKAPPSIGSIVNVHYAEIIQKTCKPRFPTFHGVRDDIEPWCSVQTKRKRKQPTLDMWVHR
jgi:DNA ligase-1